MNSPNFVVLKSIAIFLVVAMCLKHCNKAETLPVNPSVEPDPKVLIQPEKEEFIPLISKSKLGYDWRCETWSGKEYYGWYEHDDWSIAAAKSLEFCITSPGKDNCSIPICRFNGTIKGYFI